MKECNNLEYDTWKPGWGPSLSYRHLEIENNGKYAPYSHSKVT